MYVNDSSETLHSDWTAIKNSKALESIPIKLGLGLRAISGFTFNKDSKQDDARVGRYLKWYVTNDISWRNELVKYNLKWTHD